MKGRSRWRGAWALLLLASAGPAWAVLPPRGGAQAASPAHRGRGPEPESAARRASFLPDALVVKLRPAVDGKAAGSAAGLVRRVLAPIAPGARLRPVFRGRRPAAAAEATVGSVTDNAGGVYRVTFPGPVDVPAAVRRLAADPRVEYAEPVYLLEAALTPNDPYLSSSGSWGQPYQDLWGLHQIGAPAAWDLSRGDGVVIAVIDTGLDFIHPEMQGRVRHSADTPNGIDDDGNGYVDDLRGWDFIGNDADATDDHGHGTHVAGTAAGAGNNGLGVAGVAWAAKVLPVKALDASGTGTSEQVAAAVRYAVLAGARVLNLSLGFQGFAQVIDDELAIAHAAGVVVVAAAGNAAADAGAFFPCASRYAICVAAGSPGGERAWFSNRGTTVDLMAPGGSATAGDPHAPNILSLAALRPGTPAGGYVRFEGTSMASPHVAGAAALLLAARPGIDNEQVRQALHQAAPAHAPGWDPDSGYGRLSLPAALAAAQAGVCTARIVSPRSRQTLDETTVEVRGTATCPAFARYELAVGSGTAPASWTVLHSSTTPVASGTLASWSLAAHDDGAHVLRLTVVDQGGGVYEDRLEVTLDRVRIDSPTGAEIFRGGDVITVTGAAAVPGMTGFTVRFMDPQVPTWRSDGITLTGGGLVAVNGGTLAVWDTSAIARGDYYYLRLDVYHGGTVSIHLLQVLVDPTLHAGWPVQVPRISAFTMQNNTTVADVDGDGTSELLLVQDSTVRVLRHDGTPLPGWPVDLPSPATGWTSPAAGDLDGDGELEIVVTTTGDLGLRIFASDGTLRAHPAGYWGLYAAIADVVGGPLPEAVVVGYDLGPGAWVWVVDANGTLLATPHEIRLAGPDGLVELGAPALADLDRDGKADIVVAVAVSHTEGWQWIGDRLELHAFRGDGTDLPGFPRSLAPTAWPLVEAPPVVGDLDGDGGPEIVVTSNECQVFVVDARGVLRTGWPPALPASPAAAALPGGAPPLTECGPLALADVDGEGRRLEVILGAKRAHYAELHVLGADGGELPGWPVGWTGLHTFYGAGGAVIADVDGDGEREIVVDGPVNDPAYAVQGFERDGTPLSGSGFPRPTMTLGPASSNTPAVGDFDGDGLLELAWASFDRLLFLWDLAASSRSEASLDWPMLRRDAAHTGSVAPWSFRDGFETGDLQKWSGSVPPPPP